MRFRSRPPRPPNPEPPAQRHSHTGAEIASVPGALVGAAVGAIGGPAGVIAGGLVGAAIGAVTGEALENDDARKSAHDVHLDEDIGVYGGAMGVASPDAPPPRIGAYSAASCGAGGVRESAPSEGPMPPPDD